MRPVSHDALLAPLPDHRREAVREWLSGSVGDCVSCEQPVLRSHPRRLEKDGVAHVSCEVAAQPVVDEGPVSPAVEARAARSDWG